MISRSNVHLIACSNQSLLDNHEIDYSAEGYGHWGAWYRVWSDGFCEMGIITRDYWDNTSTINNSPLYLPLPFANANYTVSITEDFSNKTGTRVPAVGYVHAKTSNAIVVIYGNDNGYDNAVISHITCQGFVSAETIQKLKEGKRWSANADAQWLDA